MTGKETLYSKFESELLVRPDDIDMNNHVHMTKYLDYLLFARFDQMAKDYKVPMEEFLKRGFTWVATSISIDYKRSLFLGDHVIIQTQILEIGGAQVKINYWIIRKETKKIAAEGKANFSLVSIESGKPVRIPQDILDKYTI